MKTFIFGGSGFAKEVEWLIHDINLNSEEKIEIEAFVISDAEWSKGLELNGLPVISEGDYLEKFNQNETHNCIIAVGSPNLKRKIFEKINSSFVIFPNLIHPSVKYDERYMYFGKGIIICAGSILTTSISIEDFVHINLSVTVGHDSIIKKYVTISPGVNVSGWVTLEEEVYIGTGAKIIEKITICSNSIVGGSALVNKNIEEKGTYVGVPAKKLSK